MRLSLLLAALLAGCAPQPIARIDAQAGRSTSTTAPKAFLQLLGSSTPDGGTQHVNHGTFWAPSASLGTAATWQAWIRNDPASPSGYLISDGYGGAHALLLSGLGAGNYWTGSGSVSFGCDDGVLSRWFELSWSLQNDATGNPIAVTRVDGIPCGMVQQAGTRTEPPSGWGAGVLYVGGSNHISWSGLLAQLRVYDQATFFPTGIQAWVPERLYSTNDDTGFGRVPDLLVDYTVPATIIADLSDGYNGGDTTGPRVHHPGRPDNDALGTVYGQATEPPVGVPPQWVTTTDHPFGAVIPPEPGSRGLTPAACPAGARVCDSFNRDDQTYAYFNAPSLGSTEGGSIGPLTWQQGCVAGGHFPSSWGILNGAAAFLEQVPCVAWVSDPRLAGDQDVSVDGRLGTWGSGDTSVAFRVRDSASWWIATWTWDPWYGGYVGLAYFLDGAWHPVAAIGGQAKGQHRLRATVVGDVITIYLDDVAKLSTTDATLHGAPGIGFASSNDCSRTGLARWDNFVVH